MVFKPLLPSNYCTLSGDNLSAHSIENNANLALNFYHIFWIDLNPPLISIILATGSWPKRESIHGNRIQEIIDMHRGIQEKEKSEKEFFKRKQKEKIISYTVCTLQPWLTETMWKKMILTYAIFFLILCLLMSNNRR